MTVEVDFGGSEGDLSEYQIFVFYNASVKRINYFVNN